MGKTAEEMGEGGRVQESSFVWPGQMLTSAHARRCVSIRQIDFVRICSRSGAVERFAMEVDDPPAVVVDESPSAGFLACPECNTTKLMMPNLQLRFSTCCGRCMCTSCIENRFKATKIWTCTLCHDQLQKKNFDVLPIEEQRFKTEVQHRQETNKTFVLELGDFGGDVKEYNDYLEVNADIVYSLTYGSKAEQSSARTRLAEFQKKWRERIERSKSRKFQERTEQERRERMGAAVHTWTPPVPNGPSFILPQPEQPANHSAAGGAAGGGGSLAQEEEQRVRNIKDDRERKKAHWELMEKRRMAGGFRREDDRKRSKQEAIEGLWM
jgi:hypothetical protein